MTRLALFLRVNNIPLLMYLKVSIDGLKELVAYINTDEFKAEYGNVYIIPKRLNQDIVESFFFLATTNVWGFKKHDSIYLWLQCERSCCISVLLHFQTSHSAIAGLQKVVSHNL